MKSINLSKKLQIVFLIGIFSIPYFTIANLNQKKSKKLFDEALDSYYKKDYASSFELLSKAIFNDSTNVMAYLLYSDVCIELKKTDNRIWALDKIVSLDSLSKPSAYKFLGIENYNKGNYLDAILNFYKYQKFNIKIDSSEIEMWIKRCSDCNEMILKAKDVQIVHIDTVINTEKNEYWPAISTDDSTLFFTRLIDDDSNNAYERIFYSNLELESWSCSKELNIGGEGLSNEGTICFSANGEWLFFTACGRNDGFGSCDIYYSRKINGIWLTPKNAGKGINSSMWEAQPSVVTDGSSIYFVSNRNGGKGGKDIWYSKIAVNAMNEPIFSTPINLGDSVNSVGNDYSPCIHADNKTLYFASDGRICLGGADMFISRSFDDSWSQAQNLGFPINSRFEDDGLVVSPTANIAIFSSNREGAIANSKDLFQLQLPNEFLPSEMGYVKGVVYNEKNHQNLNVKIEFTPLNSNEKQLIQSDGNKGYTALIKAKSTYAVNISEPGYLFYSQHIEFKELTTTPKANLLNIPLTPINVGDVMVLNNIFFNFDSFQLKPESEVELDNLIDFLKMNPRLKIEILGHTDNSGSEKYNQELSKNRAKEIYNYLLQKIDPVRMSYNGYGSAYPIDLNDSEAGRMKNRRSELRIVAD